MWGRRYDGIPALWDVEYVVSFQVVTITGSVGRLFLPFGVVDKLKLHSPFVDSFQNTENPCIPPGVFVQHFRSQ